MRFKHSFRLNFLESHYQTQNFDQSKHNRSAQVEVTNNYDKIGTYQISMGDSGHVDGGHNRCRLNSSRKRRIADHPTG